MAAMFQRNMNMWDQWFEKSDKLRLYPKLSECLSVGDEMINSGAIGASMTQETTGSTVMGIVVAFLVWIMSV